jgi:hypothetical protein
MTTLSLCLLGAAAAVLSTTKPSSDDEEEESSSLVSLDAMVVECDNVTLVDVDLLPLADFSEGEKEEEKRAHTSTFYAQKSC